MNVTEIPPIAHNSAGENLLIYQGLRYALHMPIQPNLAYVDNTLWSCPLTDAWVGGSIERT